MKNAAKLVRNNFKNLKMNFNSLVEKEVLVGVPQGKTNRKDDANITNAALAYVHDNGSPALNIPARPFMIPGINKAKSGIEALFFRGAEQAVQGNKSSPESTLIRVGLLAQASIRGIINAGINPPLADSTLQERVRRGKGCKGAMMELQSRSDGNAAGIEFAKPLIDTGQLRTSINFVIRNKGETK